MKLKEIIYLQIEKDYKDALKEICKIEHRSMTEVIRMLIDEKLKKIK